jgi:hypothetical protein
MNRRRAPLRKDVLNAQERDDDELSKKPSLLSRYCQFVVCVSCLAPQSIVAWLPLNQRKKELPGSCILK